VINDVTNYLTQKCDWTHIFSKKKKKLIIAFETYTNIISCPWKGKTTHRHLKTKQNKCNPNYQHHAITGKHINHRTETAL